MSEHRILRARRGAGLRSTGRGRDAGVSVVINNAMNVVMINVILAHFRYIGSKTLCLLLGSILVQAIM
jgi:hypothetical protein